MRCSKRLSQSVIQQCPISLVEDSSQFLISNLPFISTIAARIREPASVPFIMAKVSAMRVALHTRLMCVELQAMGWMMASSMLRMPAGARHTM